MKLNYKFEIQEVAGLNVAIAVGPGSEHFNAIINLNKTGKDFFELLMQGKEREEIIAEMQQRYEVTPQVLEEELDKFVAQLQEKGVMA